MGFQRNISYRCAHTYLPPHLSQGFLQMHEESVTLHVRPSDERVVGQAATAAAHAYKNISGRSIQFTIQCTLPRDRYAQYLLSALPSHKMLSEFQCWRRSPYLWQ